MAKQFVDLGIDGPMIRARQSESDFRALVDIIGTHLGHRSVKMVPNLVDDGLDNGTLAFQ